MLIVDAAVVKSATGAGTVTMMVTLFPLESVTSTLAVPPLVVGSAVMLSVVPPPATAAVAAVTNAGLLLTAV